MVRITTKAVCARSKTLETFFRNSTNLVQSSKEKSVGDTIKNTRKSPSSTQPPDDQYEVVEDQALKSLQTGGMDLEEMPGYQLPQFNNEKRTASDRDRQNVADAQERSAYEVYGLG